ncbi:MAG: ABC transporter permease [Lewinellaceae bacterium]|nr:ABC transporter permease [Lewinellaceae bacterium]
MLYSYLRIAFRNLGKNKLFSGINLFGLTVGTSCCLYILLFVRDQRSFDSHHHDAARLYRVITTLGMPDGSEPMHMATCSPPIATTMQQEFPEVEVATRICIPPGVEQNLMRVDDRVFFEKKGYWVDSTFFRVFDYPFLSGAPAQALDAPFSVVVSEKLSLKLFNTTEAVGRSVRIGSDSEEQEFRVTGVFGPPLGNTHLESEFFMTMNSGGIGDYVRTDDSWAGNNFIYGYLRLRPGADAGVLESKLPAFLERHGGEELRQLNLKKTLALQPVRAIHTTPKLNAEVSDVTGERFLNILLLIAGFIQLVACINFMNLSTAQSSRRMREVGVRKAIGANRGALVRQFLGESMALTFVAMIFAIPLTLLALPMFNQLTGASVTMDFARDWQGWAAAGGLVLLTGIVAGSYPAFYLSAFKPVAVLSGLMTFKGSRGDIWLRKGLVVSQFVISTALIAGVMIISRQLNFMMEKDLGFEKNQKILFPFRTNESRDRLEAFRDELARLPEVRSASAMAVAPGQPVYNDIPLFKTGGNMSNAVDIRFTYADENYLKTLKIDLLSGRTLAPTDTLSQRGIGRVVVNETVLKRLNIAPEQAIGEVLRSDFRDMHFELTIVGIMKDFHFKALAHELEPFMLLTAPPNEMSQVAVDVQTNDYGAFFQKAGTHWHNLLPGIPFEHSFLDQDFAQLYESEQTLSRILGAFTLIAILISCLGLFGLSAFTAEQRTKEIGIRKVLGASVSGITGLLAKDFLKLVFVAIVIASPVAWWAANKWLADFAYRIPVQWWMFAVAGAVAVAVAFLTVSYQSIKAALANPVKSLRSE